MTSIVTIIHYTRSVYSCQQKVQLLTCLDRLIGSKTPPATNQRGHWSILVTALIMFCFLKKQHRYLIYFIMKFNCYN